MAEKEEKQDRSVHINGPVINTPINTGKMENVTMNITASDVKITIPLVSIDKIYLEKMPKEYAESLQAFTADLNQELQKTDVPAKTIQELQSSANEVAKETADIKLDANASVLKKISIRAKLTKLARVILKASPKYATRLVSMTPLAPFSGLIGEAFENIVATAIKEEPANNKKS